MDIESFIVYCSPSGSTKHVGKIIEKQLKNLHITTHLYDLGKEKNPSSIITQIQKENDKGKAICLFVGSPVYFSLAIPPVMDFIKSLPTIDNGFAIPFVTWGGASSGIALWEKGKTLAEKGYKIIGAARVLGTHSLMWQVGDPIGDGHPDENDDRKIEVMVEKVLDNLRKGGLDDIPLDTLDYQPKDLSEKLKKKDFRTSKQMMPTRSVDEKKCTQCGICQDECPVGAVLLDPYPRFSHICIRCFNCKRLCPEEAIFADLSKIIEYLQNRKQLDHEQPYTQIFTKNPI